MEKPRLHSNWQLGWGGRNKAKEKKSLGKMRECFSNPFSNGHYSLALNGIFCNINHQHTAVCCAVRQLLSANLAHSRAREWTLPSWGQLGSLPEEDMTPGVKSQDALPT